MRLLVCFGFLLALLWRGVRVRFSTLRRGPGLWKSKDIAGLSLSVSWPVTDAQLVRFAKMREVSVRTPGPASGKATRTSAATRDGRIAS